MDDLIVFSFLFYVGAISVLFIHAALWVFGKITSNGAKK